MRRAELIRFARTLGGLAATVVAALPFAACIPSASSSRCAAPFAPGVLSLSHLVEAPPLSSAFATAGAVWTLCTAFVLVQERTAARSAAAVLASGLAFCCVPTGASPAAWVTHSALLCVFVAALVVAEAPAARASRAAWTHALGAASALALGTAFMFLGHAAPGWAPPPVRALIVAAAEVAAVLHAASLQTLGRA